MYFPSSRRISAFPLYRWLVLRHSSSKLFVGGLSYDTNEPVLKKAFEKYGEVIQVNVICDHVSGKSKGYGFVRYAEDTAASKALKEMDGQYYYEPGTGRKFRSSKEVERHLNGEEYPRRRRKLTLHNRKSGCQRMIVSGGKMLKLGKEIDRNQLAMMVSRSAKASPYFKLPDGWIVEKVPRKYDGTIDKYYYEPETGRKFRSLVSVERYLAELEGDDVLLSKALAEIKENKLMSKVFQLDNHIENSIPRTENIFGDMKVSSIVGPPMKVNWVLASPHGDAWNPIISDMSIPDSVKQQWTKRFMQIMNDGGLDSPNSSA